MAIWSKLFTALKGGANEVAENIVDNQAIRILEQEIREADNALTKSDQALISIIAKRKISQKKVDSLTDSINEYESYARDAVEKGNNDLALDCAKKVSNFIDEKSKEETFLNEFLASEKSMRANITAAKEKMRQLQQQIDIVKANEAVQQAQMSVSNSTIGAGNKMVTAVDSLERIKKRQTQRQAEFEASQELADSQSGSDLDKRLAEAGITSAQSSSAEDELARILGNK